MKQLVTPWYGGQAGAGACLYMAQLVVGAGGGPYSATVAANATKYRHHNRDFPSKSSVSCGSTTGVRTRTTAAGSSDTRTGAT